MDTTPRTAKCLRCGRTLTSARSIAANYGRGCRARIATAVKTADLAEYKPAQVVKAVEVIELGGIVRTSPADFVAVSSDGSTSYQVDQAGHSCTCKAGERGIRCYHLAAADILAAATLPTRTTPPPTSKTAPGGVLPPAEGLDRTPLEVPAMSPIVTRKAQQSPLFNELKTWRQVHIIVADDLDVMFRGDTQTGRLWINPALLEGTGAALDASICDHLTYFATMTADRRRPALSVVGAPVDNDTPDESAEAEATVSGPRAALRLVASATHAECLTGCEYADRRERDDADGVHMCSTATTMLDVNNGEKVTVSVDRFQDAEEGARQTVVALGHVDNHGTTSGESREMTPAAARELAANLLAAADLAEQANQQDAARRTA